MLIVPNGLILRTKTMPIGSLLSFMIQTIGQASFPSKSPLLHYTFSLLNAMITSPFITQFSVCKRSGAQYVVLTSKHHEGYCMWDSSDVPSTWNWNVMDVGPRRDLLGDLSKAVKSTASLVTGSKIKFGVYHSLFEWFNPLYRQDKKNNWTTNYFVEMKAIAELYDLVAKYEPEIIWSDGEWEAPSSYWQARKFLSWYGYNSSVAKTAVWNDRWGTDTQCKHGSFLTCSDRYDPGHFVARKWENALTIDKTSWGYNRNATLDQYMSVKDLVHELIKVVAFNGNMLLNVGPGSDGTLGPIFVDRLLGLGEWLKINGGAIYGTRPWLVCQNETSSSTFYTRKENKLFAHFTEWPSDSILHLDYPIPTGTTEIRMLGLDGLIGSWKINSRQRTLSGITIELPRLTPANIPCDHAWVLELTNIANVDDAHENALKQHSNVE